MKHKQLDLMVYQFVFKHTDLEEEPPCYSTSDIDVMAITHGIFGGDWLIDHIDNKFHVETFNETGFIGVGDTLNEAVCICALLESGVDMVTIEEALGGLKQ